MTWNKQLEAMWDHLLTQDILGSSEVTEKEAGDEAKGLTLVDAQNDFNKISRIVIIWTVCNHWLLGVGGLN